MEKKEKDDTVLSRFDKFFDRIEKYGKPILIIGGTFVGIVIFYLNVKSTSDLTAANTVEIIELKRDYVKIIEAVNDKIESEFQKKDEALSKYRQSAKETIQELKQKNEENLQLTIENAKEIQYIRGYLKMK